MLNEQTHVVVERETSVTYLFGSAPHRPSRLAPLPTRRAGATLTPTRPTAKADEPLASVAAELARELDADAVLVVWHAPGKAPAILFSNGACEPESAVEQELLAAASRKLEGLTAPSRWAPVDMVLRADAVLTTSVGAAGGSFTVTALFSHLGDAKFGGAAGSEIQEAAMRMLPMLQSFLQLWSLRARALAVNHGLTAALNNSDVATLLVDASGRVLFANAAAERLLSANDGLRRAGALLGGTRLADTMRLQATIEHVVHDNGTKLASPVVALNRKTGRPLLAAVIATPRDDKVGSDTAAVIHVFNPDGELEPMLAPVCRLYKLSAVEGRLASFLSGGYALADAAKQMRIQEQTARSYLKQVFLKTDTNRQAELVSLMLTSAIRTASNGWMKFV